MGGPKVATLDDLMALKPRLGEVPIFPDKELRHEFLMAERTAMMAVGINPADDDFDVITSRAVWESLLAGKPADSETVRRKTEVDRLRAELEATVITVKLRGLPGVRWEELIEECPPTEKDNAEWQERAGVDAPYDSFKFHRCLVSECMVEPKLDVDQVTALFAQWASEDVNNVINKAFELSQERPRDVLKKGF